MGDVVRSIHDTLKDIVAEVIVVNDASSDDTEKAAKAAGATVITHLRNQGYGAALKSGILASNTEFVLTMDADGQHRCEDVRAVWERHSDNDMVVGNRAALLHSKLWRMPGKWLLGALANHLTRYKIPDLNSGLRLMRREVVERYIHLCPSGFSFSTTITLVMLSRGYQVEYVPIKVEIRRGSQSTVRVKTGVDAIILILRLTSLFNPLRIFLPASVMMVLAGIVWGLPIVLAREGISTGAMLAVVTGLLFFALGLLSDLISQMRLERFEHRHPAQTRSDKEDDDSESTKDTDKTS